jgi:hypothetical protein
MIVSMSGAVYAWGKNSRGQLGLGDTQVNFSFLKVVLSPASSMALIYVVMFSNYFRTDLFLPW